LHKNYTLLFPVAQEEIKEEKIGEKDREGVKGREGNSWNPEKIDPEGWVN